MIKYTKLVLLLFVINNCDSPISKKNPGLYLPDYEVPYLLHHPDQIFQLNNDLREISGLSYNDYLDNLLAVNDEDPFIYFLNKDDGEITDTIDFGKAGDYEGVASNSNIAYVVKSNGKIKVVYLITREKTNEFGGVFSRENDIEGLFFDRNSQLLLLAAKGKTLSKEEDEHTKAIYRMDPKTGKLDSQSFITLSLKSQINKLIKKNINSSFLIDMSVSARLKKFGPSAIARHPYNNDLYILSSRGSLLVVTSMEGVLKAVCFLKKSMHAQPEGICFDNDANLYISNEARGKLAVIYRYNAR